MSPPPELQVAIQSLHDDAAIWSTAASDLAAARTAAAPLDLQEFHFSYVGDKVGMTRVYAELKAKLVRLLGEGSTELENLSKALTSAAKGYESQDEQNYHRIHDAY